jgi:hypothetical protein
MRTSMTSRLADQRGVAMLTVLFVGAALTAVTSVAAFATIREFHASQDDRKAAGALSYAEAGVDRLMTYVKSGRVTYGVLNAAGCANPPLALPTGTVGNGSFTAQLTVYDPFAANPADRYPPAACANRPTSPSPGQGGDNTYFVITSTGQHPAAKRVVRQVVSLKPVGLPVGLYAHAFDLQAHPAFSGVSMISETTITDRGKDQFTGLDSYYQIGDFFPSVTGRDLTDPVPSAAHALTGIYLKKSSNPEFPPTKNCTANNGDSQSLWDSDGSAGSGPITSGCAGQVGYPSTSKFTADQLAALGSPTMSDQDYQALKDAAQTYGIYCSLPGAGGTGTTTCTREGVSIGSNWSQGVQDLLSSGVNNIAAYFEFRSGTPTQNNLNWTGSVWGCNDNPALSRSIAVIVRNGGVNQGGAGGDMINGAFIVDGNFNSTGAFTFNGTIVSKGTVSIGSSSENISMDPCWVKNMPGPFFKVVPGQWSEVDR